VSGIIQPAMSFIGNINYVLVAWWAAYGWLRAALTGRRAGIYPVLTQFTQPSPRWRAWPTCCNRGRFGRAGFCPPRRTDRARPERPEVWRRPGAVDFEHVSSVTSPTPLSSRIFPSLSSRARRWPSWGRPCRKDDSGQPSHAFYELDEGSITLDGSTSQDDREGCVPRRGWCCRTRGCSAVDRRQHRLRAPAATREQIKAAAVATHVDHFVRTLPMATTRSSTRRVRLSAPGNASSSPSPRFLSEPAILILDEAPVRWTPYRTADPASHEHTAPGPHELCHRHAFRPSATPT